MLAQNTESVKLNATDESVGSEAGTPRGLEGITDGTDGAALRDAQQRTGYGSEEMGVLVRVEMGDADAGALQAFDLGEGFALNLVFMDGTAQQRLHEVDQRRAEGFAVGAKKRGNAIGWRDWGAVGEDNMAANTKGGMSARDGNGVVKGRTGCHQCGGGQGSGAMELRDSAIDARCKAEVVCVDDEAGSHGRLIASIILEIVCLDLVVRVLSVVRKISRSDVRHLNNYYSL